MKRWIAILVLALMLTGCSGSEGNMDRAMALRAKILASDIAFDAVITADYGDMTYTFSMSCRVDTKGELTFTVTQPESIADITGTISASGGKLTFDDQALAFDLMADGQISPVAAPWVFANTLRSGYLTSCGTEGENLRLTIDDSYEEDALHLDIWLDNQDLPIRSEILWQGRRILTLAVENFTFL